MCLCVFSFRPRLEREGAMNIQSTSIITQSLQQPQQQQQPTQSLQPSLNRERSQSHPEHSKSSQQITNNNTSSLQRQRTPSDSALCISPTSASHPASSSSLAHSLSLATTHGQTRHLTTLTPPTSVLHTIQIQSSSVWANQEQANAPSQLSQAQQFQATHAQIQHSGNTSDAKSVNFQSTTTDTAMSDRAENT